MNKIFSDQIQKGQMLARGINANTALLKSKLINTDKAEVISTLCAKLTAEGEKLDAKVAEVNAQRKVCNAVLEELKSEVMTSKKSIKEKFDQEKWFDLGITDKRM